MTAKDSTPATHPHPVTIHPESLLRLRQVLQLFPVSKSTWWNGVKEGRYPQPVKLSKRCTAWRGQDIKDLLEKAA